MYTLTVGLSLGFIGLVLDLLGAGLVGSTTYSFTLAKWCFFIGAGIGVVFDMVVPARENKRKAQAEQKAAEQKTILENNIVRLMKSGLVKAVSDKLTKYYTDGIKRDINHHIDSYKHKPASVSAIFQNREIDIYSERVSTSYGSVYFQKLGYHDLNMGQIKALPNALSRYSKKWKDTDYGLFPNETYWNSYVQDEIDNICSKRGIKPLKRV